MDTFFFLRWAVIVGGVLAVWALVFWIGGASLAGWVASTQDRDPVAWFFLGLVFTPFVALAALAALPPVAVEERARVLSRPGAGVMPAPAAAATLRPAA